MSNCLLILCKVTQFLHILKPLNCSSVGCTHSWGFTVYHLCDNPCKFLCLFLLFLFYFMFHTAEFRWYCSGLFGSMCLIVCSLFQSVFFILHILTDWMCRFIDLRLISRIWIAITGLDVIIIESGLSLILNSSHKIIHISD